MVAYNKNNAKLDCFKIKRWSSLSTAKSSKYNSSQLARKPVVRVDNSFKTGKFAKVRSTSKIQKRLECLVLHVPYWVAPTPLMVGL